MARPFYPHEADDPDLDWLVSNFLFERPDYVPVEAGMLPLMLLPFREEVVSEIADTPPPHIAAMESDEDDPAAEPWED